MGRGKVPLDGRGANREGGEIHQTCVFLVCNKKRGGVRYKGFRPEGRFSKLLEIKHHWSRHVFTQGRGGTGFQKKRARPSSIEKPMINV